MRLYPPAPVMTRIAAEDIELGDETSAPARSSSFPIFAMHRHRKLWDDPDRFDPDALRARARKPTMRARSSCRSASARALCIGMSFAMMEAQSILATLVRGARFEWDGLHRARADQPRHAAPARRHAAHGHAALRRRPETLL